MELPKTQIPACSGCIELVSSGDDYQATIFEEVLPDGLNQVLMAMSGANCK